MATKRKPSVKSSGRKSAKKATAKQARQGVPQPHGGVLVPGAGGGPQPGSGRPKAEFKQWCQNLLDDETNRGKVEEILKNPNHPAYATMFKAIADRAFGKPKQSVEVDTGASLTGLLAQAFGKGGG